jgi:hypothetical protein
MYIEYRIQFESGGITVSQRIGNDVGRTAATHHNPAATAALPNPGATAALPNPAATAALPNPGAVTNPAAGAEMAKELGVSRAGTSPARKGSGDGEDVRSGSGDGEDVRSGSGDGEDVRSGSGDTKLLGALRAVVFSPVLIFGPAGDKS